MATDERLIYLARIKVLSDKTTEWLEGRSLGLANLSNMPEQARRKLEKKILRQAWKELSAELRALTGAYNQHEDK